MIGSVSISARRLSYAMILIAASNALPLGAQPPNARAVLPGYATPILLDTLGIAKKVTGSRDSIYAALFQALGELGIPVEARDREAGLAQNLNVQMSRRLGKTPLSKFFDCGRSFAGDNADLYRLTLAMAGWVATGKDSLPRLYLALAAGGQDQAGSRSGYVMCNSTGRLEDVIAQRVRQLLGAS
jgi:hypothetical protein